MTVTAGEISSVSVWWNSPIARLLLPEGFYFLVASGPLRSSVSSGASVSCLGLDPSPRHGSGVAPAPGPGCRDLWPQQLLPLHARVLPRAPFLPFSLLMERIDSVHPVGEAVLVWSMSHAVLWLAQGLLPRTAPPCCWPVALSWLLALGASEPAPGSFSPH